MISPEIKIYRCGGCGAHGLLLARESITGLTCVLCGADAWAHIGTMILADAKTVNTAYERIKAAPTN